MVRKRSQVDEANLADVLIVGSGATGGWTAKELTERGHRVLLLEAGPRLEPASLHGSRSPEEHEALIRRRPIQAANRVFSARNAHLYVDDVDHPYSRPPDAPYNWIRTRSLGGRTLLWTGVSLRLSDHELAGVECDGSRISWPFHHQDLSSHYTRVEKYLGVRGVADGLPQLPDGHYVPPATTWEPGVYGLADELRLRWPDRRMIQIRDIERAEHSPRSSNGFPWCSSVGSTLQCAARTGRLTIRPDAVVTKISVQQGRASSVSYVDRTDFTLHQAQARVIVLAASAIESTRILLNSASEAHPSGLGNASGTLGRFLSDHFGGPYVRAFGPRVCRSLTRFYIPRFRNLVAGTESSFQGGFSLEGTLGPAGPRGGLMLTVMGEVLPRAANTIRLDRERIDRWGMPLPVIELRYSDNDYAMAADALGAMVETAEILGFQIADRSDILLPPGTRSHELGGARMGSSPKTSVLTPYNQCWEIPNLFVVDGACFPTAGYQNPTLTMLALADRACDVISDELARGHL